jgi:nucleoid-associated protein YgaU
MMAHVFAASSQAARAPAAQRWTRLLAAAILAHAVLFLGVADPVQAIELPLAASELSRIDLAALPGLPPPREAAAGARGTAPVPSVAEWRPAVPEKDRLTRFLDWLDSSEQDFQRVVIGRLSVPATAGGPSVADAIDRAATWSEAVASEAGQRFAELSDTLTRHADKALSGIRVAQAGKPAAGAAPSGKPPAPSSFGETLAPVTDWLERSAQDFQSIIMRRLSVPSGPVVSTPASQPSLAPAAKGGASGSSTPPPAAAASPADGQRGLADRMGEAAQAAKDWVTQSKRDFQERVVDKLTKPEAAARKAEDDARAAKQAVEAAERKVRELRINEEKAKEKAQLESPAAKAEAAAGEAESDMQRRKAVIEDAARKAVAEQKRADAASAEQKRLADEAARRKKAEADLAARRAAEETAQKKLDETRRKADEASRAAARQREEAARMAQEANRAADALLAVPKPREPSAAAATVGAATSSPPSLSAEKRVAAGAKAAKGEAWEHERAYSAKPKGKGDCRAAGRRVKPPAVYVVARGDSLWVIARRHYKKGSRWVAIHKANDDRIANPDLIYPCQQFYIPRP